MRAAFLAITLAALFAAPARADVYAVTQVVAQGRSDTDVGLIDASTGTRLELPAGINTPADERHPSISQDGRRLAFERRDSAAGTVRIIGADAVTGQTLDLFDAFSAVRNRPTSPVISPDGEFVSIGSEGQGLHVKGIHDFPNAVTLDESSFYFPGDELLDPTPAFFFDNPVFAFRRKVAVSGGGTRSELRIANLQGASPGATAVLPTGAADVAHPAIRSGTLIYDISAIERGGNVQPGDSAFCLGLFAGDNLCINGRGALPRIVSSLRNESSPAFTPDGRDIGFIRDEVNGHERVYVFDTATQTLLDPDGADLGVVRTPDTGSLSLYEKPVFLAAGLPRPGTLVLNLANTSGVGLLVQRVIGHHRLLGRRVPKLRPAGRIPLGRFRHGRHTVHWRARGLRPGRYQFTPRALTKSGRVRDLGKPRTFRIR